MGTRFDLSNNILFVWRYDNDIIVSKESELDPHFILHYNDLKILIAISVIDALKFGEVWKDHPLRQKLPQELLKLLDIWFWTEAPTSLDWSGTKT